MEPERLDALRAELGDRLAPRVDAATRERYARDRSSFRRLPAAVVQAHAADEVAAAVAAAARAGVPVTARAGGSSVAGQCLGSGLVIDVSGLRGIEPVDGGWESVWCGVGEDLDSLNAALAAHGRAIGPDVTSSALARVGGLVATNACGSRSLRYGRFADVLEAAEVVLADGTAVTLAAGHSPAGIATRLESARSGLDAELGSWPRQPREPGGYRLPALAAGGDALSLVAGSEGTLCVLTRVRLRTVPLAGERSLALCCFDSLAAALDAAPELAAEGASAVELLDARLAAAARSAGLDALREGAGAALLVEHLDGISAAEAARRLGRRAEAHGAIGLEGAGAALAWRLRSEALSLAGGDAHLRSGNGDRPVALSGLEDPAVPPASARGFCMALVPLLQRFGFEALIYGHAGAGCLHVRPLCDPSDPHLGDRLLDAAEAVCDLAGEWGGCITGEHGWGLARSHLVERALGSALYARCAAVKEAFDPEGVLNPGIVVGGHDPRALVDVRGR